jgi:hypothetical protein
MNSFTELKDALIADEIIRIKSLTQEGLVEELIDLKSKQIESLSPDGVMNYLKNKKYGKSKETIGY